MPRSGSRVKIFPDDDTSSNTSSSAPPTSVIVENSPPPPPPTPPKKETYHEYNNMPLADYIKEHFYKRICNRYVLNPANKKNKTAAKENQYCCCGFKKNDHDPAALSEYSDQDDPAGNQIQAQSAPWNPDTDTVTVTTDAFGEIEFSSMSQKVSKFIRVESETNVNELMHLMLKQWNMEKPNLLISVTGGAKNFRLSPRLKEVFRQGLIKAASSTGAWIMTGGTNAGVMKHVGEAIRDSAIAGSKTPIVAVGVATWGCINSRQMLVKKNGCWPVIYKSRDTEDSSESPLEPNHTHFILVDNGTQNKFGAEIKLRGKLESKISTMKALTGDQHAVTVPVVCIVLEGGPNTMETVKSAIDNGTPVIIVAGSGRAANILAYAYSQSREEDVEVIDKLGKKHKRVAAIFDDSLWVTVKEMIMKEYEFKDESDGSKYTSFVKDCIKKRDHMTVFSLDDGGSVKDIDVMILKALLKVNNETGVDQLKLALAWNRIDVAREEIFTDDVQIETRDLEDLLYSAIIHNCLDFVKLFLERGVNLKDFLTIKRLVRLYNEPLVKQRCPLLYKNIKKHSLIDLGHVGDLIKELTNDSLEPLYCREPYKSLKSEDILRSSEAVKQGVENWRNHVSKHHMSFSTKKKQALYSPKEALLFEDAAKELFLWCILMHMQDLAVLFWHEGKDDLALALHGQLILQNILDKEKDSDMGATIKDQVSFYKDLAVNLLEVCYACDPNRATLLLVRELPNFDSVTVLEMAVEADNLDFVSHPCCQNLLTTIWMGQLTDDNSSLRILICTIFPLLAPPLLTFRDQDQVALIEKENAKKKKKKAASAMEMAEKRKKSVAADVANVENGVQPAVDPAKSGNDGNAFSLYFKQLYFFYDAPIVTFFYYCIFYFGFILLYGIILLTDFRPTIELKEMILMAWIGTMIIEEIRQLCMDEASTWRLKFWSYFTDKWNLLDVGTIVVYVVGVILRCIPLSVCPHCFYSARIILALDLMMFFFRILHLFSVHRELGPKLVMIGRMMRDLFYFVIVLLVFISAYGIASQVILYPNQPLSISLARDVMSQAWWDVFGQLNIQEVAGQSCPVNDGSHNYTAYQCAELGYDTTDPMCWGKPELCPADTWFVSIMLAVYALIVNVMMLNLLIAMFSNTFASVQERTTVVWKMQRYHLVKEYCSRPVLPPPLIIIQHIFIFARYLGRRFCNFSQPDKSNFSFKMRFSKMIDKELLLWENANADEYLRSAEASDQETLENRVKLTNDRVDCIMRKVEELAETNFLLASSAAESIKLPVAIDERFCYLEKQMKRTSEALDWIIKAMSSKDVSKVGPPALIDIDKEQEEARQMKEKEVKTWKDRIRREITQELELHVHSRQQIYPSLAEANINRFYVPTNQVLFEVEFKNYKPVGFTDKTVLDSEDSDPDLLELEPRPPLPFNKLDTTVLPAIDRRSLLGEYRVVDGIPLNPKGRTGLCERGVLARWGPNHCGNASITRWKRNEEQERISKNGKGILEFLAIQRSDNKDWSIPEVLFNDAEASEDDFIQEILSDLDKTDLETLDSEDIYSGYLDDPRNTDNAWLETKLRNYHDDDGSSLDKVKLPKQLDGIFAMKWLPISSTLKLHGCHLSLLCDVAKHRHAAF